MQAKLQTGLPTEGTVGIEREGTVGIESPA